MKGLREGPEIKDILVKKSGWRTFVTPVHKKILPILLPSGILGFVLKKVIQMLLKKEFIDSLQGKLFITAIIFLYAWFVLLLFLISCLLYTIVDSYQKKGSEGVMERLNLKRY